jgi:hypothetical protein
VRVEAAERDALRRLADADQRSPSGAARRAITDLLSQRGLLPAGGKGESAKAGQP